MGDVRTDVVAFAREVLNLEMWAHQIEAARSQAFITTVAAARRTGKTEMAEILAMWTAFRERNVTVLITSATQDSARRLTESIGAKLNANPLTRGAVVDGLAMRLRLANGSQIISLPASQRQVRGYGKGVRLVILDEAGFMPSEMWPAAHYTALDERPRSRILMVGTPWGPSEHFFRRAFLSGQGDDPDHESFQWTFEANPNLDRAYLERMRDRVAPQEYAAEVLGEWSDAVGSLFPRELLHQQTTDVELPRLEELQPSALGIAGVDWGVSYDRSAVAAVFRLPVADLNDVEPLPRFLAVPYVWPASTPLTAVVDDICAAKERFQYVCPETNGVGAMPSQELMRRMRRDSRLRRVWNFCHSTNAKKTAGYGCVLALLERGQLILPRHPELLRQLAGLRFEQGERGFTRIEADDAAVHDDLADALMLATVPHNVGSSRRIVCRLAAMARNDRAAPDVRVPELDEQIVETGAGLRVYQRPALQSVTGSGLTLTGERRKTEPVRVGRFTITGGP